MPKHARKQTHFSGHSVPVHPDSELQKMSIFNNIVINVPVEQKSESNDEANNDDCSCWSALLKCLKPG